MVHSKGKKERGKIRSSLVLACVCVCVCLVSICPPTEAKQEEEGKEKDKKHRAPPRKKKKKDGFRGVSNALLDEGMKCLVFYFLFFFGSTHKIFSFSSLLSCAFYQSFLLLLLPLFHLNTTASPSIHGDRLRDASILYISLPQNHHASQHGQKGQPLHCA